MNDGVQWHARGPSELTAWQSIHLGGVDAGTNALTLTAGDRITDHWEAEGAGGANLVASNLTLMAKRIGDTGSGDIDVTTARLDAKATAGSLYVAANGALQLGDRAPVSAPADIDITVDGPLSIGNTVTAGSTLALTTTQSGAGIQIGADLVAPSIELISAGAIARSGAGVVRNPVNDTGRVWFSAARGIGSPGGAIEIDAAVVSASARGGGVYLDQIDGIQGNLTIGGTGITSTNGNIVVQTRGNRPSDAGHLRVLAPVRVRGWGEIVLRTLGSNSDIIVGDFSYSSAANVTYDPGRYLIDLGLGNIAVLSLKRERERLTGPEEWSKLDPFWAGLATDWSASMPEFAAYASADDYAVPDFGGFEEAEFLYMSGGNESLWGPPDDDDEDERRRREESQAVAGDTP
jgi:hypothetical protein